MCDAGRLDCERPTTRQDGQCAACDSALRRAEKKMAAAEAEHAIYMEDRALRADLQLAGIM